MANKKKSKVYKRINPDEIAKALGAERITDPKEIEKFKRKHGLLHPSLPKNSKVVETCGNCKHWDTGGFGFPNTSEVGQCDLVSRHWYPCSPNKMIALNGVTRMHWPNSELIEVVTRREFGCNQFQPKDEKPLKCRIIFIRNV